MHRIIAHCDNKSWDIPGAFNPNERGEAEMIADCLTEAWQDSGARGNLVLRLGLPDRPDVRFTVRQSA